ncbi:MAG: Branched-chain amino acid transporter, amino acid-binding protein [Myxococcaceae bacterium]|nr:Branched-chain amino acid transporter, amino acid-binding protein [Myxococcaceae bacterium]
MPVLSPDTVLALAVPRDGHHVVLLLASLLLGGCDLFNDDLERRLQADGGSGVTVAAECRTHADCAGRDGGAFACVQPRGECVALTSPDCTTITGDLSSPQAIVLGSLFSTSGPQGATNLPRQQSAMLAIEALNSFGGVPGTGSISRPLVLVSCDEAASLDRAAAHLIDELKVPAIVGPNVSQDVIDVTNGYSAAGGTVLISPTAVASSIADLRDNGLTWIMVPSDEQRAPLMKEQIGELEKQLRTSHASQPVTLSIIYRNDALGNGTRVALNSLTLNGKPLADNAVPNVDTVRIEPYEASDPEQSAIVARQIEYAPSIIVLAGLSEAITQIMLPLEQGWGTSPRPYYVLIDSLKVPEVLMAATTNDDLRKRIRGTGIVPTSRSLPVYSAFQLDYAARWPGSPNTISGMGPSYDATYAIAYALAATRDLPVSGASIAMGLAKLSLGGPELELESTKILAAFSQLTMGQAVSAIGTYAPLSWDSQGAPRGGRVEVWCISPGSPSASYASSGLSMDLKSQVLDGHYTQCN